MSSFLELGLPQPLVDALEPLGFEKPTPVQAEAIPTAIKTDKDLVIVAKTGTGKTAAFGLPLLARLEETQIPRGLVLAPTRELACQIADDLRAFGANLPTFHIVTVYGGANIQKQMSQLKRGASVVVATPGRLLDLERRGALDLSEVTTLVIDEADEILNMGFEEDVNEILSKLPEEHATWLFSATMPKGVVKIAQNFMTDPLRIDVAGGKNETSLIDHIAYEVAPRAKFRALVRLVDANPDMYGIVFCRTRRDVQELNELLVAENISSAGLHGDLNQGQRDYVMLQFRKRRVKLLIATDIAARGIDVNDITHVIHYDIPESFEAYTHRSGRTGRAGKTGRSLSLVTSRDRGRLNFMTKKLGIKLVTEKLPKIHHVYDAQIKSLHEELSQKLELPEVLEEALTHAQGVFEDLDRETLINTLCIKALSEYIKPERMRDIDTRESRARRERSRTREGGREGGREHRSDGRRQRRQERDGDGYKRSADRGERRDRRGGESKGNCTIHVNAGKTHGFNQDTLKDLLSNVRIAGRNVKGMKVGNSTSSFNVSKRDADAALRAFKGYRLNGKRVSARQYQDEG